MPVKDRYHDAVRTALVKDGWTITHDPLRLEVGKSKLYVDLAAERLIAADKGEQRIAVEVKSFLGHSVIADFEDALGQYLLYGRVLQGTHPGRLLWIAMPQEAFDELFNDPEWDQLRQGLARILVYEPAEEVIIRWTS